MLYESLQGINSFCTFLKSCLDHRDIARHTIGLQQIHVNHLTLTVIIKNWSPVLKIFHYTLEWHFLSVPV